MNHSQAFYANILFACYQILLALPICTMAYIAVGIAWQQKQEVILKWLLPLTLVHTLALLYSLYSFGFRLLHLRAGLTFTLIAYGFGVVGGLASLYTTWRILEFVKSSPWANSHPETLASHEEGAWPPPPIQKP